MLQPSGTYIIRAPDEIEQSPTKDLLGAMQAALSYLAENGCTVEPVPAEQPKPIPFNNPDLWVHHCRTRLKEQFEVFLGGSDAVFDHLRDSLDRYQEAYEFRKRRKETGDED